MRSTFLRSSILLLLLWIGSLVHALPQSAEPKAPELVPCSVCRGLGQFSQECLVCGGDGERGCPLCNEEHQHVPALSRDEKATAEQAEFVEHVKENQRDLEGILRGGVRAGFVPCPARCVQGRPLLVAKAECKYCAGNGGIACPTCIKKGVVKCRACAGRGQVMRTCEACNGARSVPDPRLVPKDQRSLCPWCADTVVRDCADCDSDGRIEGPCQNCAGTGSTKCSVCVGSKSAPCARCSSSGFVDNPITGRNDCAVCHRKGRVDCDACHAKGATSCTTCRGTKVERRPCPACGSDRKRPCLGCFRGSVEAWERTADPLAKAGDFANAVDWLEGARAHAKQAHAKSVAGLDQLMERGRKALDAARDPSRSSPPLGSDGKPIDLHAVEKLLDDLALSKKTAEEKLNALDARLVRSIEALRAKATPGR